METATITTDKLYLQNKARMYMLNFFTDTDCINHFFVQFRIIFQN